MKVNAKCIPTYKSNRIYADDWNMPNPSSGQLRNALWKCRYDRDAVSAEEMGLVLACVESYLHFVSHRATTGEIIKQLRWMRRSVKYAYRFKKITL